MTWTWKQLGRMLRKIPEIPEILSSLIKM